MVTYKVWVQIERLPDRGNPENADEPVEVAACGSLPMAPKVIERIADMFYDEPTTQGRSKTSGKA